MKCIICGVQRFQKLRLIHEVSRYTKKRYPLYKCQNCNLVRPNPLPYEENTKKTIYDVGENIKFFDQKTKKFDTQSREYRYYFKHFKPFMQLIKKYNITGKSLDVGCGPGHLLKMLAKKGFDAEGLEISPQLVKALKSERLKVKCLELSSKKIKSETYNLVTLNQVLEHITNPETFVKDIYRVLKNRGYVILAVPYLHGVVPQILRTKWYGLGYGQHLNFFSEKNLKILFERNGFEIIEFKRLIVDYAHPKFPKILNIIADSLSKIIVSLNLGDNLFLVARKIKK